jgi:uncharacterized alkaline shock family protein YloU
MPVATREVTAMIDEALAVLPCRTSVGELLEQAVDAPGVRTAHQRACVHCQATLGEFETLWLPVRASAATTPVPPPDLVRRVIERIHAAVSTPGWAVLHQPGGITRVALQVVLRVVRDAAESVDGVRSSLASLTGGRGAAAPVEAAPGERARDRVDVDLGISGSTVAVSVTVAVEYGPDLRRLGDTICRQVQTRVESMIGVAVATVSVSIDDISLSA